MAWFLLFYVFGRLVAVGDQAGQGQETAGKRLSEKSPCPISQGPGPSGGAFMSPDPLLGKAGLAKGPAKRGLARR
jgi:hypothetical protein